MPLAPPWLFGNDEGTPTWFTPAFAEVKHVKGKGVRCTRCDAAPSGLLTADDQEKLEAYLAEHVNCRPVWAKDGKP